MSAETILETRGLTKAFQGFVAVDDVTLTVRRGMVHALIGPNGAGKTTVFNLLTRLLPPTRGEILFKGRSITRAHPADVPRLGLVRSFQISAVFPHLTVAENVRIALQRSLGTSFHFWKRPESLDVLDARTRELLEAVGLGDQADRQAVELPYGRKRALELCTTLALDPEMLLLDEPTAGMGHEDVSRMTELIRGAAARRTVLLVEHNLRVVASLSHVITVLQRGRVLAEGSYAEVSRDPEVKRAYMGSGHARPGASPPVEPAPRSGGAPRSPRQEWNSGAAGSGPELDAFGGRRAE